MLPHIDDGSRSAEMTRSMLEESKQQGVSIQIATPHFYASHDTPEHFLEKRSKAFEAVKPIANEIGIELLTGAEVAFFRGMSEAEALKSLLIADTDILLLEMPFRQWTESDIREVKQMIQKGIHPVIAHIERFTAYQKDKAPYEALFGMDVTVQVNAEALLSFMTRGQALKLFKNGTAKILASDCHNTSSRPQNLQEGRAILTKKLGKDILRILDGEGERLLSRKR